MDAAAQYHHASPIANHIRAKTNNTPRTHVAFAMRFRPDITKTIVNHNNNNNNNNNRLQHLRVFCFNAVAKHMATTKGNQDPIKEEEGIKIKEEEEEQKSKKILPPPPEKPEPGDCCGSGCVRCVWDVYYDELDAYNNLYNKSDDSNAGNKN